MIDAPPQQQASVGPAWRSNIALAWAGGAFVVIVSVVVLLWPRPPLWLDEAQSVAIARRSLPGIIDALRADGAPPLYYFLLHAWMSVFGSDDVAVRSLSVLFALAAVAVLALVAGRSLGWQGSALVVLFTISHPFFVRYATETRMYSLVMLEIASGALFCRTGSTWVADDRWWRSQLRRGHWH